MEQILHDTSQSIMEIAHDLNFPDDKHFYPLLSLKKRFKP